MDRARHHMQGFVVLWLGQFFSLFGSGLTDFALGVWVCQQTKSTTQFALMLVCVILPRVLIAPLAGPLVDRWNRRWTMILSDFSVGDALASGSTGI